MIKQESIVCTYVHQAHMLLFLAEVRSQYRLSRTFTNCVVRVTLPRVLSIGIVSHERRVNTLSNTLVCMASYICPMNTPSCSSRSCPDNDRVSRTFTDHAVKLLSSLRIIYKVVYTQNTVSYSSIMRWCLISIHSPNTTS